MRRNLEKVNKVRYKKAKGQTMMKWKRSEPRR